MSILAFLVTWAILGAVITTFLSSIGLVMFLAVIAGIIGGLIANALAWIIFSSSASNPFSF